MKNNLYQELMWLCISAGTLLLLVFIGELMQKIVDPIVCLICVGCYLMAYYFNLRA